MDDPDLDDFIAARVRVLFDESLAGNAIFRCQPEPVAGCGEITCDGKVIRYDPKLLRSMTPRERADALVRVATPFILPDDQPNPVERVFPRPK